GGTRFPANISWGVGRRVVSARISAGARLSWAAAANAGWYLTVACLAGLSVALVPWKPLPLVLLLVAIGVSAIRATSAALRGSFPTKHESVAKRFVLRGLTALLYLLQPLWRLEGRLRNGLSPWRRRRLEGWAWPRIQIWRIWSEQWRAHEDWLRSLEKALRATEARVIRGGAYDRWDLELARGSC